MDERELTGTEPREVVGVYRRPLHQEVVGRYSRPLPGAAKVTEQPKKKRSKKGLWIALAFFSVILILAVAGWMLGRYWMWRGMAQMPYLPAPTEHADKEITIPAWPTGQGAELTVCREVGESIPIQEIYQTVNPSVVTVLAAAEEGFYVGTGVVFSEDGYILTNHHVLQGASECIVTLVTDHQLEAMYVAGDAEHDLAILKINAEGMPAARFGDSDQLEVGDPVYAIGNPLGVELRGTLTDGIVSAINRDVMVDGVPMTLLQTNAALNSGNSGGPLINESGQVVGINVVKMTSRGDSGNYVEGLGFAIPTSVLERVVNDLLTYGQVTPEPVLGISVYQTATQLDDTLWGAGIQSVVPGSPSDKAGILAGDFILAIGEEQIETSEDVLRVRRRYHVGDEMIMTLWRNGLVLDVTLELDQAVE